MRWRKIREKENTLDLNGHGGARRLWMLLLPSGMPWVEEGDGYERYREGF